MKLYRHSERQPGNGIIAPAAEPDAWDAYTENDTVFVQYWDALLAAFPDNTWYLCDEQDRLLVSATAVPLYWEGDSDSFPAALPDEGWRWVVRTAVQQHRERIRPNLISALGINVSPGHRGQGLSQTALQTMRNLAREQRFRHLIAPVRPSQKHRYPLIPMSDYITWTREDGLLWDAWLRTHQRLGAEVIKPCERSMIVPGTVAQWRDWTGMAFPGSGAHVVPGALSPVQIDLEADRGVYTEANVWMLHRVD